MFRFVSLIAVSLFAINCGRAEASPIKMLDKIQSKVSKVHHVQPARSETARTDCESLTGTWVGTCQISDGTSESDTIVIKQGGCWRVAIDGDTLHPGGMDQMSNVGDGDSTQLIYLSDWNAGRTGIVGRVTATGRELNISNYWTITGRVVWEKVGDGLVVNAHFDQWTEEGGQTSSGSSDQHCEYTKAL